MSYPKDWFERTHSSLTRKGILQSPCPACEAENLELVDQPRLLVIPPNEGRSLGAQVRGSLCALVGCQHCGYLQFHSQELLGIADTE